MSIPYSIHSFFNYILLHTYKDYICVRNIAAGAAGLAISSVFSLGPLLSGGMQRSAELENDLVSVERLIEYEKLESEAPLTFPRPPGLSYSHLLTIHMKYEMSNLTSSQTP